LAALPAALAHVGACREKKSSSAQEAEEDFSGSPLWKTPLEVALGLLLGEKDALRNNFHRLFI
jgi:hypothetical protein